MPPDRPPRDSQRIRVYRAETPRPGRHLETLADCAAFLDTVVGSLWWQARFPEHTFARTPRLRPGHGARQAFYRVDDDGPTITLPRRYRTTGVLLHELGHWALDSEADLPHHGRTFARLLLDLTAEFAGDTRAELLARAFEQQRVRVGAPARLGGDARWRYGWDERLHLNRGREVTLRYDADGACGLEVTGVHEGSGRRGTSVRIRMGHHVVHVPRPGIWDVRAWSGAARPSPTAR